jgi:hypothetical protein
LALFGSKHVTGPFDPCCRWWEREARDDKEERKPTELGHLVDALLLVPAEHCASGIVVDSKGACLQDRHHELEVLVNVGHDDGVGFCK